MRQPVQVVKITECSFPKPMSVAAMNREYDKYAIASYWRVDAGFVGDCGHKHRSEKAAEGCLTAMKERYRIARWGNRKRQAKT